MEELKPCPFCKGEAHYNRKQIQQGYIVVGYDCKQCGAAATVFTGPMTAEKNMKIQATEAWNRRAEPENKALEQLKAENANLQEALKLMAQDFYDSSDDEIHTGADSLADDYIQMAQVGSKPENKPLTCDGCALEEEYPMTSTCQNCSRRYADYYASKQEGSST